MGVWALRLALGAAPVAWCCAVMFYSRRGLCGPGSAVMSLELDGAILHISAAPGEVGSHHHLADASHQPCDNQLSCEGLRLDRIMCPFHESEGAVMKLDAEIEHLAIELGRALGNGAGWRRPPNPVPAGGGYGHYRHCGQLRLVRSRFCHLHQRGQTADAGGEPREP